MTSRGIGIPARVEDDTAAGLASIERRVAKTASEVEADFERAGSSAGGLTSQVGKLSDFLGVGLAGAAGIAVGAIGAIASAALSSADQLAGLSSSSGASAEALQEWGYAAQQSGGSAEDVADAFREMQLRLADAADGSGPAVAALDKIGVSLETLMGLSPDRQFALLRDRISEVEDPAARLFAAEELLGGASERLASVLGATSDEAARLRQEAHDTGQVMSDETVASLDQAHDSFARLAGQVKGAATEAIVSFAEAIGLIPPRLSPVIAQLRDLQDEIDEAAGRQRLFGDEVEELSQQDLRALAEALDITTSAYQGKSSLIRTIEGEYGTLAIAIEAALEQLEAERDLAVAVAEANEQLYSGLGITAGQMDALTASTEGVVGGLAALASATPQAVLAHQRRIDAALAEADALATLAEARYLASSTTGHANAFDTLLQRYSGGGNRVTLSGRGPRLDTSAITIDTAPGGTPTGGTRPAGVQDRPARPERVRLGDYLATEEGYSQFEFDLFRLYGSRDQYGPNQRINLGQDISRLSQTERDQLLSDFGDQYYEATSRYLEEEERKKEEERERREAERERRREQEQDRLAKMIGDELSRNRPPCPPVTFLGSLVTGREVEQTIAAIQEQVTVHRRATSPITGVEGS